MANKIIFTLLLAAVALRGINAQDIPERPQPPRLVNDFAGLLGTGQISALENKLVAFNDSTSIQIAVVIVKSLRGLDKADYAYRVGEKWGVGQKGKNNGVVILLKPKYDNEKGEVFIASGYGMEGVLPDALCKRIVENEMIPEFRAGDYYKGIDRAADAIIAVSKGEYKADKKTGEESSKSLIIIIVIILIIIFIVNNNMKGKSNHTIGRSASSAAPFFFGSGRSSGGWGSFSSGSGGFGGFGGGSFGGGGSGGSW